MNAMDDPRLEANALREKLLDIVAKEGMVERADLVDDAELDALGIKSADFVLVLMEIESEYGVYLSIDGELSEARTVGAMLEVVTRQIMEHHKKASS
jgi:acyl carrier protein